MNLVRLLIVIMIGGLVLGCGSPSKPVAKKDSATKKTSKTKTTSNPSSTTTKKASRPLPVENSTSPGIDFTPPGLRPGSEPVAETAPPVKSIAPATSQGKTAVRTPAGKTRQSASGLFEYWMPNGVKASDPFDFRSGDLQSKGLMWLSRSQTVMLGFAEVRLHGPATKEILKQTAEQSSAGEDQSIPWVETTFCGCTALERNEVLDLGEVKSHTREIIFIDGDTIYQVEGLEPGDKPVNEAVKKLFASVKRIGANGAALPPASETAKKPTPGPAESVENKPDSKDSGVYVRSPESGAYEVWMPHSPIKSDLGDLKYKDRQAQCWEAFLDATSILLDFAELDVGEPATLAITHTVVNDFWHPETRGTSTRQVKYAGHDAIEQTVIGDDELQVRYFIPIGKKIYFVAVIGTDKQGGLPDVTKFLASFRKKGETKAPSAMKDIPGGFVTKREPPE